VSIMNRSAEQISGSVTRTHASTSSAHSGSVMDPSSTPPAVPSLIVGRAPT